MYKRILVPVENSSYDAAILTHVQQLARENDSSIVLIHVADGWAARNIGQLHLRESEEMHGDRAYIEKINASLEAAGFDSDAVLASGDPANEIVEVMADAAGAIAVRDLLAARGVAGLDRIRRPGDDAVRLTQQEIALAALNEVVAERRQRRAVTPMPALPGASTIDPVTAELRGITASEVGELAADGP